MSTYPSQTHFLVIVVLAFAFAMCVLSTTTASTGGLILQLPANILLIVAILLASGPGLRIFAIALSAIAFAGIEISFGRPLASALAFAFANSAQLTIACLLLQKLNTPALNNNPAGKPHSNDCPTDVDELTGLIGRGSIMKSFAETSPEFKSAEGVLLIDIDNFRRINVTLGPSTGDLLLKSVANRLSNIISPADTIARIGDDEFAVLMKDGTTEDTAVLAKKIVEAVHMPILVGEQNVRIGASIGVAVRQTSVDRVVDLMRQADIALKAVKASRRGGIKLFEPWMAERLRLRQRIEQELRQALSEQALDVHYQPIVHLASNEVIGFEALVRWHHAERGFISPAEFIPIAEEVGLIGCIDDWVLRRACRDAMQWPSDVKLSVNFSRAQFESPAAQAHLEAALSESEFPPRRLQLEITETTVMADIERANTLLDEFRELGIEIAMDDFGTGYSSLSCLRNCSCDRLKIDRTFVKDLTTSLEARAILGMVVDLAAALGMETTAEGVETPEQYAIIREKGCTSMQGYYFRPPLTSEDVLSYFQSPMKKAGTIA